MIENFSNRQFIDNLKALGSTPPPTPVKSNYPLIIALVLIVGIGTALVYRFQQQKKRANINA